VENVVGGKLTKEVGKRLWKEYKTRFCKHKETKNKDGNYFKYVIEIDQVVKTKHHIYKIKTSLEK
jgi:hypothetical protein